MLGEPFGINWGAVALAYAASLIFGLAYNWIIEQAERAGFMRAYVSIFVAGGCAALIALTGLVNLHFALVTAGAFIAGGTPMIVGSMIRHQRKENEALRKEKEALHGDAQETLAP